MKKSQSFNPNIVKSFKNEVITITSDNPYSEDNFERKLKAKLPPSNKLFSQPEEELLEFRGKQHMEPNKLSSEHIKIEFLTLTSETPSSEYCLETKLQAKLD